MQTSLKSLVHEVFHTNLTQILFEEQNTVLKANQNQATAVQKAVKVLKRIQSEASTRLEGIKNVMLSNLLFRNEIGSDFLSVLKIPTGSAERQLNASENVSMEQVGQITEILSRLLILDVGSKMFSLNLKCKKTYNLDETGSYDNENGSYYENGSRLFLDLNVNVVAKYLKNVVSPATIMILNSILSLNVPIVFKIDASTIKKTEPNSYADLLFKLIDSDLDGNGNMDLESKKDKDTISNNNEMKYTHNNKTNTLDLLDDFDTLVDDTPNTFLNDTKDNGNDEKDVINNLVSGSIDEWINDLKEFLINNQNESTNNINNNEKMLNEYLLKLIDNGYLKKSLLSIFIYKLKGPYRTIRDINKEIFNDDENQNLTEKNVDEDEDEDDMFADDDDNNNNNNDNFEHKEINNENLIIELINNVMILTILNKLYKKLTIFIENQMIILAPNLSLLLGTNISAELITLSEGLENLVKIPSCNILVLGSNKQNKSLLGLSENYKDKYGGIIWKADLLKGLSDKLQRKLARTLSSKVALASRFDLAINQKLSLLSNNNNNNEMIIKEIDNLKTHGIKLKLDIEKQIDLQLLPLNKSNKYDKPIIIQDETNIKKKRGGKRSRNFKNKMKLSNQQMLNNRINLSSIKDNNNNNNNNDIEFEIDDEI